MSRAAQMFLPVPGRAQARPQRPLVVERFDVAAALEMADAVLSGPPARPHIERPVPRGRRVARFALPLDLCKPQNRTRRGADWQFVKTRQAIWATLLAQGARVRREPLPGRPQVLVVRFSSVEPDRYNDGAKAAIDALCAPSKRAPKRFNYLVDDAPRFADVHQYWEPAPPKRGCTVIEIWTGE